jgi:arylsulfatase A-like enzyme
MVSADRPNLVLAVVDTARADVLSPERLPGVRHIAAEGTMFRRAISAAPWTLPAHGSLFSGLLPFEHGLTGDVAVVDGRPRSVGHVIESLADRWLSSALMRAGYRTFGASANPWIAAAMGWGSGFERFVDVWNERSPRFQVGSAPRKRSRTAWLPEPLARRVRSAYRVTRAVLGTEDSGAARSISAFRQWLGTSRPRAPYFAFFNFMEAHAPYLPPRAFGSRSLPGRAAASRLNSRLTNEFVVRFNVGLEDLPEHDLSLLRDLYGGEVEYLDVRLANLAEEVGLANGDTVLVVVGDHGEHLGERHLLGHQASLSDRLLWVPLMVAGPPDLVPRGEVGDTVSTKDVCGTLLQLAGILGGGASLLARDASRPVFAWYESAYAEAAGARALADGELSGDPTVSAFLHRRAWTAYRGMHKIVVGSDGSRSLFDLAGDPDEMADLAVSRPDLLRPFRDLSLPLNTTAREVMPPSEELDEIERHLESLGYV